MCIYTVGLLTHTRDHLIASWCMRLKCVCTPFKHMYLWFERYVTFCMSPTVYSLSERHINLNTQCTVHVCGQLVPHSYTAHAKQIDSHRHMQYSLGVVLCLEKCWIIKILPWLATTYWGSILFGQIAFELAIVVTAHLVTCGAKQHHVMWQVLLHVRGGVPREHPA